LLDTKNNSKYGVYDWIKFDQSHLVIENRWRNQGVLSSKLYRQVMPMPLQCWLCGPKQVIYIYINKLISHTLLSIDISYMLKVHGMFIISKILIYFVLQTLKINRYNIFNLITLNFHNISNTFYTSIELLTQFDKFSL